MLSIFVNPLFGETASDYKSLHDFPKKIQYISESPCLADGNCGEALPYGYLYEEVRTSFRYMADVTDSKVLCVSDSPCSPEPATMRISATVKQDLDKFRLYIPPGTISVHLSIFVPRDDAIGALCHIGGIPIGDTGTLPVANVPVRTYSVQELYNGSHATLHRDGAIYPVGSTESTDFITDFKKRWLFVKMLKYSGGYITDLNYTIEVNVQKYKAWYTSMSESDWLALEDPGSIAANIGNSNPDYSVPVAPNTDQGTLIGGGDTIFGGLDYNTEGGGNGSSITLLDIIGGEAGDQPTDENSSNRTSGGTTDFSPLLVSKYFDQLKNEQITRCTYDTMKLKPILNGTELPGGFLKFYAAYIDNGNLFIADRSNEGAIYFSKYIGGDIPYYNVDILNGANLNDTAFASLPDQNVGAERTYIVGVTSNDVCSVDDFIETFQGAWFKVDKSL